jgi:hypothetical protein
METPEEEWARFRATAERGDMRIQVVRRAINQGALAGLGSEVSDYAAWLVIDALDSFDADADRRSYEQGFRQGVAFGEFRTTHR